MMSTDLHPDLVAIGERVRMVHDLLQDPQPGLYSWNSILLAELKRLAAVLHEKRVRP